MGTRADFYVGRGPDAEWLGSIAWDGYPDGVFGKDDDLPFEAKDDDHWRVAVAEWLARREDATLPEQGWPWPWDDSATTDYAYAVDDGVVYASSFGYEWFVVACGEPRDEDGDKDRSGGKTAMFPDMRERKNFTMGTRSGVMLIGAQGPIPGEQIDAEEAQRASYANVQDVISLAVQRGTLPFANRPPRNGQRAISGGTLGPCPRTTRTNWSVSPKRLSSKKDYGAYWGPLRTTNHRQIQRSQTTHSAVLWPTSPFQGSVESWARGRGVSSSHLTRPDALVSPWGS